MDNEERDLKQIITREILGRGPMPFSRYMELCLYHPQLGYYQRQEPVTGTAGDFYTAPHVHGLFGRTVGQWIRDAASRAGLGDVTVLELGPGNGQLARDILDHWKDPRRSLSMILVEEGGPRRRDLEARFAGDPVRVVGPEEVDDLDPFQGVVLANEFFDALPLRVFSRSTDGVLEVFVDGSGEGFREALFPAQVDGPVGAFLEELPEGFRTEVSDHWRPWMARAARVLEKGFLLLLDYGEVTDGLLVPWRTGGTLRCYRRHEVDNDPYEAPGEKDITAHVNFTLLREAGREAGLDPVSLTSQSSFLIKAGILEMLAQRMEGLPERESMGLWLTVKNLIHEDGMGEVFKAMVMKKG